MTRRQMVAIATSNSILSMHTTDNASTTTNPYRLGRTVIPSAYRLRFDVDLDGATFAGSAVIDVDIAESVSNFVLNAAELDVSSVTVQVGDREFISDAPAMNDEFETATFHFHDALPLGKATLSLTFNGILNDHLRGFYRSTYTDSDGVEHRIATTQFESTDARRAFPCWDEPAFKATYQVTLEIPEALAAFSNTKEISSKTLRPGRREVCFAQTMIMSTYLVAFVVGPFEASPETIVAGTPVRIVYPLGKGHLIAWAMELAVHALEYFSEYFAIAYPGDKLDLVAIPDFASGAMENLGCVTFRETELLIDVSTASHAEMENVALVVNHELAHMWFGDLVTMDWWEGIWLNEAFATFMEMLCSDHFRPAWKKWASFNPTRDMAFSVDGQHSTRPIEYEVVSPNDCRGMFDILTYIKGSAILRMLEQYLGATTFRDGIRIYLERHAYANTVTADLWSALEVGSGQPVGEIMDTWILQGGYPLVSVKGSTLTQRPFEYSEAVDSSNIGHDWKVPVMTRSLDGGPISAQLLADTPLVLKGDGVTVVNAGGSGFYRTAYDSESLMAIAARLADLDDIERAVLFSDTWASILVGQSSFIDLFVLAKGLIDLDEPATWSVVARAFDMANRILDESDRDALAAVVQSLCAPVLGRLGWDPVKGETTQAGELRAIVVGALGAYGRDEAVISEALARFDAEKVSGDLANAIVAITMQQGRMGDLETCEQRRLGATNPQDEQRYLFAPASSSDPAVVIDAFERSFTTVRTQDAPYLVGTLVRNRDAGPQIWKLMSERWDEAEELFPDGSNVAMVGGVVTFGAHPDLAREVRKFHQTNPVKVGQQQVEQILDLMDLNVALATRNKESLGADLRGFTN
jgi:puromycin-sensitive aminopeptidase